MEEKCLQEKYAPHNACFGCGPANPKGLKIRSFPPTETPESTEGTVIASWKPEPYHEAFPGVLNGGIIGTLLDCHCNWTAAWYLMNARKELNPPCTVTAEYTIKLRAPTPSNVALELIAKVIKAENDRVTVHAELYAKDMLCATCDGQFVAVKPGHPAYHRW